MLKKIKGYIYIVFLLQVLFLSGCGIQKIDENVDDTNSNTYYRTIIEANIGEDIVGISKSNEGGVYILTEEEKRYKNLWKVDSEGAWTEVCNLRDLFNVDENYYDISVSSDGELFVQCNVGTNMDDSQAFCSGKMEYFFVDTNGERKEVDLKLPDVKQTNRDGGVHGNEINHGLKIKCIGKYVYLQDANDDIYRISKNESKVDCVFENDNFGEVDEFDVYENCMIVWSGETVCYQNLDSKDDGQAMSKNFTPFFKKAKKAFAPIFMEIDGNNIWTLSEDILCMFNTEEKKVDYGEIVGQRQGDFILDYVVSDGIAYALISNIDDDKVELYKYYIGTKDEEICENTISGKIRIWSAGRTAMFDEVVRCFRSKYPNVEVVIEDGLGDSDDSNITVTDAIKNLNTDILSGNGPDIIYMDGLNIKDFVRSNNLYDITDIIGELSASGEYYNNILETYKVDEKIFVVPSSVFLVQKVGTREDIEASENISTFADYINNNQRKHDLISEDSAMYYVLGTYYRDIKNDIENGTISREKIYEYFEGSKKFFNALDYNDIHLDSIYFKIPIDYAMWYDGSFDFVINSMGMISISGDNMAKEIEGVVQYPAKDYAESYIVSDCIAISSNAQNLDIAKEYLKTALSEECQSGFGGANGFCVNKKAFEKCWNREYKGLIEAEDNVNEAEITPVFDKRVEETNNSLEMVCKSISFDEILDSLVFDEMNKYLNGDVDIDSSVNQTMEKIKLYLEE